MMRSVVEYDGGSGGRQTSTGEQCSPFTLDHLVINRAVVEEVYNLSPVTLHSVMNSRVHQAMEQTEI